MITFIICSLDPVKASAVEQNVRKTIGVPCEFIIEDNREKIGGVKASALYITIVQEKPVMSISASYMRMWYSMEMTGDSLL